MDRVAAFTDPTIDSIKHRMESLEKYFNADILMSLPWVSSFYVCFVKVSIFRVVLLSIIQIFGFTPPYIHLDYLKSIQEEIF